MQEGRWARSASVMGEGEKVGKGRGGEVLTDQALLLADFSVDD